jgi:hypothetical protein
MTKRVWIYSNGQLLKPKKVETKPVSKKKFVVKENE